jgi:precorrin-6B methylase 2
MHKRKWAAFAVAVCTAWAFGVAAQEESVRPGVNKSFVDPDVEYYQNLFEGESRTIYKFREEILETLELSPGDDVADIGAGTGFFSLMFAEAVGPKGTVCSVDIAQNFLDLIDERAKDRGVKNIKTVLGGARDTHLKKGSVDVAFICDTYHHFEYPYEMMKSLHRALRPGGRVIIVDFERIVGVTTDFSISHVRCGKGTVTDEVKDSGFDLVAEPNLGMSDQYILVFRKREADGE